MGRRGPPPTPTESLKLRGSTLVTKRRQRKEAKGPSGIPVCPDWLDGDGKAMWKTLVPQLEGMGVLTEIDRNALSRYCRLWSRWRSAESFIDKHGEMYPLKDDSGKVKYMQPLLARHHLANRRTRPVHHDRRQRAGVGVPRR